ncbi:MAG TPA: hypothetical protein VGV90_01320 [Solirubrobacteraceae bacterium]|nr:hypothetical protein [Solirubrobacteraceae bacterium]
MAHRWRVQATWTVGGDKREYAPVFVRTKARAARTSREMEKTLAHFPTLVVTVEKVPAAQATRPPKPILGEVHSRLDGADTTACGRKIAEVSWIASELFDSAAPNACRSCAERGAS